MPPNPDPSMVLTLDRIEEIQKDLHRLHERQFSAQILEPYFRKRGYEVEDIHNKDEKRHGLDLLLVSRLADGSISAVHGVQVKRDDYSTFTGVRDEIEPKLNRIFSYEHVRDDGKVHRITKLYWVTSGRIHADASNGFKELQEEYWDKPLELWGASGFLWDVHQKNWHFLIEELDVLYLETRRDEHIAGGRGIFAAYFAFELFRRHLRSNPPDLKAAEKALDDAIYFVERDPRRPLFWHRLMLERFHMWRRLLASPTALRRIEAAGGPSSSSLANGKLVALLARDMAKARAWSLYDIEFLYEQLTLLRGWYFAGAQDLLSHQIARTMLCAGFPPELDGLATALQPVRDELEKDGSLDSKCTICTGTGLSCLGLAGSSAD